MKTSTKIYIFLISLLIIALFAIPALPTVAGPPAAPIEPGELLMEVPLAAPTPISNVVNFPEKSRVRTVYPSTAITVDTNTASFCFGDTYAQADYMFVVDQGAGEANTNTLTIQFSNDGTNWDDGPALLSANAADAVDISRVQLFGACQRIKMDLDANARTVTIGITALPK